MTGYVTNDIFRASALIIKTNKYPDNYYQTGEIWGGRPVVYMAFTEMPDDLIHELEKGQMKICPLKLAKVYREMRKILIEQAKEQKNNECFRTAAGG